MKNTHFSSNYDFSGRPLGERTQQTNIINKNYFENLNNSYTPPGSNDNDVKITSVYQKRNHKTNYDILNTINQTSKLEHNKYEGLNYQSETSNEYHVIRSTNKYQHKATKRKRETGGSDPILYISFYLFF